MAAAAKPHFAALFLLFLALGVSLGLPAEDVLDVAYDEWETLPYETIRGFSVILAQTPAPIAKAARSQHPVIISGFPPKPHELPCNTHGRSVSDSRVIRNHSLRC